MTDARNHCPDCKSTMTLIQSIVGFPTIFYCRLCGLLRVTDHKDRVDLYRVTKEGDQ